MISRYIDTPATIQVIGNIYNNPSILDNEKYKFNEEDFPQDFHKIIFGTIFNLHQLGAKEISINTIEDYLYNRPTSYGIYQTNKGREYLEQISQNSSLATFEYYYFRIKKMTLLRMYDKAGLDLKWLYDIDNILDTKKKQAQEDWLDNTSLEDIADTIDKKINEIKLKYVDGTDEDYVQAGNNIDELIDRLQKNPEIGYPLYGPLINTITRGARLKKLYLRSAATGVGKTRAMIADACNIACDEIYNIKENKWEQNGTREPTLYITTEQEVDEIQTMMLAFLSGVNEAHIIYNRYEEGELDRVKYAAKKIKTSPLHIKRLPDFSLQDIENAIKFGIHEWGIRYVFFDYLHTSLKILSEVSSKAGIKGLREDNVLFMIAIRLKDLCNEYGVFIMTSTQLNSDYTTAQQYDQNLLRGAKSIADKIDFGAIMLQTSQEDKEALKPILLKQNFEEPTIKISIYKNRRGQYKDILLWCKADRGICRIEPMFCTTYQYEIVDIPDLKIKVNELNSASAF